MDNDDVPLPPGVERPVTAEEVMRFLSVRSAKLYQMMDMGIIPYHQMGGTRRFFLSEVSEAVRRL